MHLFDFLTQSFITLLVIINPFAVVPIFLALTQKDSSDIKKKVALKSCFISLLLLCSFSFLGDYILDVTKISVGAFRITGGFLLLLSAIEMVRSNVDDIIKKCTNEESNVDQRISEISVFPLSIPFLAGPGALTSVVILMREAGEISFQAEVGLIGVLVAIIIFAYCCLRMSQMLINILGLMGTNILTKVFGIILSALSVQSIINGIKSFF
ncbi:MAG: hypothetical protein C0432_03390 [Candidatus Puniceispirillum sp.]|nr:hypothetical protein [Candidatus Pelagibacter sp.]MBA4283318.1 hypothetical protein [Candidatus Puniceispirillum sp.]